jgi:hypothetical protein
MGLPRLRCVRTKKKTRRRVRALFSFLSSVASVPSLSWQIAAFQNECVSQSAPLSQVDSYELLTLNPHPAIKSYSLEVRQTGLFEPFSI